MRVIFNHIEGGTNPCLELKKSLRHMELTAEPCSHKHLARIKAWLTEDVDTTSKIRSESKNETNKE